MAILQALVICGTYHFMAKYLVQTINVSGAALHTATQGYIIKVSHQDMWDINFNTKTGTVESWKVIYEYLVDSITHFISLMM